MPAASNAAVNARGEAPFFSSFCARTETTRTRDLFAPWGRFLTNDLPETTLCESAIFVLNDK